MLHTEWFFTPANRKLGFSLRVVKNQPGTKGKKPGISFIMLPEGGKRGGWGGVRLFNTADLLFSTVFTSQGERAWKETRYIHPPTKS